MVSPAVAIDRDAWDCDGYLVVPDFFDAADMDRLDTLIHAHYGPNPQWWHNDDFVTGAATEVVPWFPGNEREPAFDELIDSGPLPGITEQVLGRGWRPEPCMVMFSPPKSAGQAWHQDCPPEDPERFNLNRLVYTADIPPEVGGQLVLVPGSHRRGLLPAGEPHDDLEGQVVIAPSKGTLVLVHGHLWHRVLPIGGTSRTSINFRAVPGDAPEGLTDICVYRNMRYRFSSAEVIERR